MLFFSSGSFSVFNVGGDRTGGYPGSPRNNKKHDRARFRCFFSPFNLPWLHKGETTNIRPQKASFLPSASPVRTNTLYKSAPLREPPPAPPVTTSLPPYAHEKSTTPAPHALTLLPHSAHERNTTPTKQQRQRRAAVDRVSSSPGPCPLVLTQKITTAASVSAAAASAAAQSPQPQQYPQQLGWKASLAVLDLFLVLSLISSPHPLQRPFRRKTKNSIVSFCGATIGGGPPPRT